MFSYYHGIFEKEIDENISQLDAPVFLPEFLQIRVLGFRHNLFKIYVKINS